MTWTILYSILTRQKPWQCAALCWNWASIPPPAVVARYSQLNLAQWKLLELGQLTRQEVKLRRYQLLFEELGIRQDPGKAARIYEAQLGIGPITS